MTDARHNQIEDAARQRCNELFGEDHRTTLRTAFYNGAYWADNNPFYHMGAALETAAMRVKNAEEQNAALIKERDRLRKVLKYVGDSIHYNSGDCGDIENDDDEECCRECDMICDALRDTGGTP